MLPPDCELDESATWCVVAVVFWIFVVVIMKVVFKRFDRSDMFLDPWLSRLETQKTDQTFNEHTLKGRFNSRYLRKESPSASDISIFNDTYTVRNLKDNAKGLRNLLNAYHENITYATRVVSENRQVYITTSHGIQTNLKNLLADKTIKFTRHLIVSLINDITSGLFYLHYSPMKFHGDLNSNSCVITSEMKLKISNFGITVFNSSTFSRDLFHHTESDFYKLWLAPELLRGSQLQATPEADVYAFSILVHEIVHRKGPFNIYASSSQSVRTIVNNVGNGPMELLGGKVKLCRPTIQESNNIEEGCPPIVRLCLEEAWRDNPAERPPINEIYRRLWLLSISCRKQAGDDCCDETSRKLQMARKEKATKLALLNELVPSKVIPCFMHDFAVKPTTFESISVLFIKIRVSGTEARYSNKEGSNPSEEQAKVIHVCKVIDELIKCYDIYKVENVKETYVVASGMYSPSAKHESEIALFALHLCHLMQADELKWPFNDSVYVKLGIHKGQAAAGIIGLEKPSFHLFGDTVIMASRLCTTSEFFRIQISSDFKDAIQPAGSFESCGRGMVHIKGKGWQNTFWLIRSRHPFRVPKKLLADFA